MKSINFNLDGGSAVFGAFVYAMIIGSVSLWFILIVPVILVSFGSPIYRALVTYKSGEGWKFNREANQSGADNG